MHHRKSDIIKMANLALVGQISPSQAEILEFDDALYFWMMFSVGSAIMSGGLSPKTGKRVQYKVNHMFDRVCLKFKQAGAIQRKVIENRQKYSVICSDVSRELNSEKPDGGKLVEALLRALDALTGDDVFLKLYVDACRDKEFMKNCQAAVIKNDDLLTKQFGQDIRSEDYFHILSDFYSLMVKENIAEAYKDFGELVVTELEKGNTREAAESIKQVYEVR